MGEAKRKKASKKLHFSTVRRRHDSIPRPALHKKTHPGYSGLSHQPGK